MRILVERFDGAQWVENLNLSEDFDGDAEDAKAHCVKLLAELYIGLRFNILDYRCQFLGDGGKVTTVTSSHPDFNEACDEERDAEAERAAEHRSDERDGR